MHHLPASTTNYYYFIYQQAFKHTNATKTKASLFLSLNICNINQNNTSNHLNQSSRVRLAVGLSHHMQHQETVADQSFIFEYF